MAKIKDKFLETAPGGGGGDLVAIKSANESVANSATFQNDDHLFLTVESNTNYILELFIFGVGAFDASLKMQFTAPAGCEFHTNSLFTHQTISLNNRNVVNNSVILSATNNNFANTNYDGNFVHTKGILSVGGNSGTLQLQWAQVTEQSSNTTFYKGSFLKLKKVS